ncbi:MAG: epimerase, partial [Methanobacteriota archaeon]
MKVVVLGGSGVAGRHVVEALRRKGADAVPASRRNGVDLATGAGLREALAGAQRVIDVSSDASPDEATARAFFTASARHLQREAERAGVERLIVVSIVGVDRLSGGYGAAKLAQERA